MADLSAATVDDVAAFFKTYYAPNNAVLSIVGDVDTKTALAKVREYFGAIPAQPAPPKVDMTEPPQRRSAARRSRMRWRALPRLDIAYKIPPSSSPDGDALDVLATILSGGRSSRFYEAIVRQKQLASGGMAPTGRQPRPRSAQHLGTAAPGKTLAELEAAIDARNRKGQDRADRGLGD